MDWVLGVQGDLRLLCNAKGLGEEMVHVPLYRG